MSLDVIDVLFKNAKPQFSVYTVYNCDLFFGDAI